MDDNKPMGATSASKSSAYVGWLVLLLGTLAVLGLGYYFKP